MKLAPSFAKVALDLTSYRGELLGVDWPSFVFFSSLAISVRIFTWFWFCNTHSLQFILRNTIVDKIAELQDPRDELRKIRLCGDTIR